MNEFKGTSGPWFVGEFGGVNGNGKFIGANPKPDGCTYVAEIQNDSYNTEQVARLNAKLIAVAADLLNVLTMGQTMQTPEFLHWIADRLVYVHGENANSDFIISLRKRADAAQVAIDKALGTDQ